MVVKCCGKDMLYGHPEGSTGKGYGKCSLTLYGDSCYIFRDSSRALPDTPVSPVVTWE